MLKIYSTNKKNNNSFCDSFCEYFSTLYNFRQVICHPLGRWQAHNFCPNEASQTVFKNVLMMNIIFISIFLGKSLISCCNSIDTTRSYNHFNFVDYKSNLLILFLLVIDSFNINLSVSRNTPNILWISYLSLSLHAMMHERSKYEIRYSKHILKQNSQWHIRFLFLNAIQP